MRMFKKNRKGFTLVELIVVVAVLAVLASIAVPVAGNLVSKANKAADASQIAVLQSAIERYTATTTADGGGNGVYPADGAAAIAAIKQFTNLDTIPKPKDSAGGAHFVYNTTTHKVSQGTPGASDASPFDICG